MDVFIPDPLAVHQSEPLKFWQHVMGLITSTPNEKSNTRGKNKKKNKIKRSRKKIINFPFACVRQVFN